MNKFYFLLLSFLALSLCANAETKNGTITFGTGTNSVKINAASVTAEDDLGNSWTITTVGTTSFTPQPT